MILTLLLFLISLFLIVYGAKNFKHKLIDISIIVSFISILSFLYFLWT
jgi:hypothetical protein